VLRATFVPHVEFTRAWLAVFVALLGTSISPYLFFWQAAEEVEEERAKGRKGVGQRKGATAKELRSARTDVLTGMALSNVIMYFIIMTTAATLHSHGMRDIATAKQAAEALRPVAGRAAYLLFTLGLVGTGVLAVPVLAGSCAYAIAEARGWAASLEHPPRVAAQILYRAGRGGFARHVARLSRAGCGENALLVGGGEWSSGAAPDRVVVLLTSNPKVMGHHVNPPVLRWLGWITGAVMAAAAVAMFVAQ
jgi:Mn2+/Fe2+ NRAMP family transporter